MLVHNKTDDKAFNFRELAPAAATELMFFGNRTLATTVSKAGGLQVLSAL